MIRSMTAFSTLSLKHDWGVLTAEIRSVNHRYLDISLRLPDELRSLEMAMRERITAKLQRGKIDCSLRYKPATDSNCAISLNDSYVDSVIEACQTINNKMHQPSEINPMDILRWPGVVFEGDRDTHALTQAALQLIDQVITDFIECREREGERLLAMIKLRCDAMAAVVQQEIKRRPIVEKLFRDKLLARVTEMQAAVDMSRFEQDRKSVV